MARLTNRLTERGIATIRANAVDTPGKLYPDGNGLYLQCATKGSALSWVFRYKRGGKVSALGLGPLHALGLADARSKATELRKILADGKDPQEELRKSKADTVARLTFAEAAAQCVATKAEGFKNKKHIAQWSSTINTYAGPIIGNIPVGDVTTDQIAELLQPIWTTKSETATRLRQRIESVFDWAKAKKQRTGDNPAALELLEHLLPKLPKKTRRVRHHPSLPWSQLPAFMQALKGRTALAARALELLILTAARSQEVRGAEWKEFDLEARFWTVPADRMKMGVEHKVPLPDAAIELLRNLPRFEGTDLLFPSNKQTWLSDDTLGGVIERMNESEDTPRWVDPKDGRQVVPHGFRSSFRVWVGEATEFSRDLAEFALAHKLPDVVEAAYMRSALPERRVPLMQAWAVWVTSEPTNVIELPTMAQAA